MPVLIENLMDEGRCKAKAKGSGERCKNRVSPGREVCRIHGGAKGSGRPVEHGRYSVKRRGDLQDKISQFYNDPAAGDLRSELALLRAFLQDYLDRWIDSDNPAIAAKMTGNVFEMVDQIGKLVERIAKILATTALTQAELQLLQVTLIDAIAEFIPEPDRQRAFVSRIAGTFGGSVRASIESLSANTDG